MTFSQHIHGVLKLSIMVFLFLTGGTTILMAQHDHGGGGGSAGHNHSQSGSMSMAPHGGMVKTAGKYQIEMVVDMLQMEDKVVIYIINSKGRTIGNASISGKIMFMYKDQSSNTSALIARGDDHFVSALDRTDAFTAMVTFDVKGKMLNANFNHAGLNMGTKTAATYTCSMHPEIQMDSPGSCPKCGMTLMKK